MKSILVQLIVLMEIVIGSLTAGLLFALPMWGILNLVSVFTALPSVSLPGAFSLSVLVAFIKTFPRITMTPMDGVKDAKDILNRTMNKN